MAEFKPDERQQELIQNALRSHRKAQARGRYAPQQLVEKWISEAGIEGGGVTPKPAGDSDKELDGK